MDFVVSKILGAVEYYYVNYKSLEPNMEKLKRKYAELNSQKEDMESALLNSEMNPRKKSKKEVRRWFECFKRIEDQKEELEGAVSKCKFYGRPSLAELASEMIQQVQELQEKGSFPDGLVVDELAVGQLLPTTALVGETAKSRLNEILGYLRDDKIGKIGVVGMLGVGKTAVMKHINNLLIEEAKMFDAVVWVTASKEKNIAKLQNDIARALNVHLPEDEDETRRTGNLYEVLSNKKRCLLILDGVGDRLSLEEVGIPEPCNGSKLVLTTRSLKVCRSLDCKVVRLKPLPKQEAWELLLQRVGLGQDNLNTLELLPIVRSVAEKCFGLPLAIIEVSSRMRGVHDPSEWRNMLNELNQRVRSVSDVEDVALEQMQLSFT